MNKKIMVALAVALGVMPAISLAQETKPVGLSVRAGVAFPTSSSGKNAVGKSVFAAGVDYKIGDLSFGGATSGYAATYGISLDYYGKGDNSAVPVLVNYIGRANEFYYKAGIGASFQRSKSGATTTNRTRLGYTVGLGYEFSKSQLPLFAEFAFHGSSDSDFNAFALYLGVRF